MDALTLGDYRFALSSLVLLMGVALICSLLLKETLSGKLSQSQEGGATGG
jgi:hypothetical protein